MHSRPTIRCTCRLERFVFRFQARCLNLSPDQTAIGNRLISSVKGAVKKIQFRLTINDHFYIRFRTLPLEAVLASFGPTQPVGLLCCFASSVHHARGGCNKDHSITQTRASLVARVLGSLATGHSIDWPTPEIGPWPLYEGATIWSVNFKHRLDLKELFASIS